MGIFPGIALIGHELLENCHSNGLAGHSLVLKGSDKSRNVLEADFFGEKSSHLEVAIDALLKTPKKLQNQFILLD
jgi:hypothetical protein